MGRPAALLDFAAPELQRQLDALRNQVEWSWKDPLNLATGKEITAPSCRVCAVLSGHISSELIVFLVHQPRMRSFISS